MSSAVGPPAGGTAASSIPSHASPRAAAELAAWEQEQWQQEHQEPASEHQEPACEHHEGHEGSEGGERPVSEGGERPVCEGPVLAHAADRPGTGATSSVASVAGPDDHPLASRRASRTGPAAAAAAEATAAAAAAACETAMSGEGGPDRQQQDLRLQQTFGATATFGAQTFSPQAFGSLQPSAEPPFEEQTFAEQTFGDQTFGAPAFAQTFGPAGSFPQPSDGAGLSVRSSARSSAAGTTPSRAVESGSTSQPGTLVAAAGKVLSTPPPMLPFSPPESVKTWLRREDWEALSRAWAEAEAQAVAWAEGEADDIEDEALLDWSADGEASRSTSHVTSSYLTVSQTASSSSPSRRRLRKRPEWDQDFALLGQDSRRPAPMRRYFDALPAEVTPPTQAVRREFRPRPPQFRGDEPDVATSPGGTQWIESWGSTASTDNDKLHPFLRHYFSNRGMEASYRARPHLDCPWLQSMKPRTPGRPSTREKLMKWQSASEPSLGSPQAVQKDELDASSRGAGNIHWGTRCLLYGPDGQVKRGSRGEKIPWVYDHHISETDDNELMNPLLRHYFDQEGVESSFRNRGRHYGRPKKMCFGLAPLPQKEPTPQVSPKRSFQSSSVPSRHSSQQVLSRPQSLQTSQQPSRQGLLRPSLPASWHNSAVPSRQPSMQPSMLGSVLPSRQHSRQPPSMIPSFPHSQQPSRQTSLSSVLQPPQPSRHPSLPGSLQPSRSTSHLVPCLAAPQQTSQPVSRQPSLPAVQRASVGSPIGSAVGSLPASPAEASEDGRRSLAPVPAY